MSFEHIKSYTVHGIMPEVLKYYRRIDDPGSWDYDKTEFVNDNLYNIKDLSGQITEVTACLALVKLYLNDNNICQVTFRHIDDSNNYNAVMYRTVIINVQHYVNLIIPIKNKSCIIRINPKPGDLTGIYLQIRGFWYV